MDTTKYHTPEHSAEAATALLFVIPSAEVEPVGSDPQPAINRLIASTYLFGRSPMVNDLTEQAASEAQSLSFDEGFELGEKYSNQIGAQVINELLEDPAYTNYVRAIPAPVIRRQNLLVIRGLIEIARSH